MAANVVVPLTYGGKKAPAVSGKILLVKPPYFTPWTPPLGIAILKSFVEKHGFSAKCYDFNIDPELWGMHHKYFEALRTLEDVSINDGYSKLWWILNAHMLAYANGADARACSRVLKGVIPLYAIGCNDTIISCLISLVENFFKRLEHLIDEIDLSGYSVVGTSTYTTSLASSLFLLKKVKQKDPRIKTLIGGGIFADDLALGSDNLDTLVREYPYVDHIVIGEGELLLLKLLQGEFADKRVICLSDLQGKTISMNDVPTPDFSDLDNGLYYQLTIEGARSCPFQCSFCSETIQWGEYRKKPASLFAEQVIELSQRHKSKGFFMGDSLMNPYINPFSSELIKREANILYDGYLRADKPVTNRKFVRQWAESGLFRVRLGIESASPNVLQAMDKMTTPEVISEVLKSLASEGIRTTTYWIVGFPGETEEDFQQTCEFIREHRNFIYELEAHPYYYYPYGQTGSRLYRCYSLYPDEVTEIIKFRVWEIVDADPDRMTRYERLRRISKLASDLGLPNIYTMVERYRAEDRWHLLHPLAAEVYAGTRPRRSKPRLTGRAAIVISEEWRKYPAQEKAGSNPILCYRINVAKRLDEEVLSDSIDQLVRFNEMLQVQLRDGVHIPQPNHQKSQSDELLAVYRQDITDREILVRLSAGMRPEPGRSIRAALVDGDQSCHILLLVHRAIADCKSVKLLCEDLFRIYEQLANKRTISLRPVEKTYLDFIGEQRLERGTGNSKSDMIGACERAESLSLQIDENLTKRVLGQSIAVYGLKPIEAIAAASLASLARADKLDQMDVYLKADCRCMDSSLDNTVGPLTQLYRWSSEIGRDLSANPHAVREIMRSSLQTGNAGGPCREAILLNFEYLIEEPWLGGAEWTPQGFLLDTDELDSGYVMEVIPTRLKDGLQVHLKYRDYIGSAAESVARLLPRELESIAGLAERSIERREFWLKEFSGYSPGTGPTNEGDEQSDPCWSSTSIDSPRPERLLQRIGSRCSADLATVALSAFGVLLSRLNWREDLVIIAAIEEGQHIEVVPMRLRPSWSLSFEEFVRQVEQKSQLAFKNGERAFSVLADELSLFPVFDAAYLFSESAGGGHLLTVEGLKQYVPEVSHLPLLSLEATRAGGSFALRFVHRAGRFRGEPLDKIVYYLSSILEDVAIDAGLKIEDITLDRNWQAASAAACLLNQDFSF